MDILPFDRFIVGRHWLDDYGYPDREEDFRVLRAYSLYHNIRSGTPYPAILVNTVDTDDRVVPDHSFKYTVVTTGGVTWSKAESDPSRNAGRHGFGKPTDKAVAESADILAFVRE